MIKSLEEALNYISQLESENKALREEVERYRAIKPAGRKKHDATWTASYNDFVVKYESGMSIMEIARELGLGVGEVKLVVDLYQGNAG